MSNQGPNTIEPPAPDLLPTHRPRGVPDSFWRELVATEAELGARREREDSPFQSTPGQPSGRNPRLPLSILELARSTEALERRAQGLTELTSDHNQESDHTTSTLGNTDLSSRVQEDRRNIEIDPQESNRNAEDGTQPTSQEAQDVRDDVMDELLRRQASLHFRLAESARAATRRSTVDLEPLPDESRQQFMERHRRSTMHRIDRQQDFAARARQMRELRSSISANADNAPTLTPAASNVPASTNATLPDLNVNNDRSANTGARRDLERALREYRIARRAFRTHLSDSGSPAEQNVPSYQGVMAQIAEQQSNNRNRMRARGQSRASGLGDQTDEIVERLTIANRPSINPWRSEDDAEISTSDPHGLQDPPSPTSNVSMPPMSGNRTTSTSNGEPYLGPTTTARGNGSMSGGMRDFYQRIEERQRNLGRSSLSAAAPVLPPYRRAIPIGGQSNLGVRDRGSVSQDTLARPDEPAAETEAEVEAKAKAKAKRELYEKAKAKAEKMLKYLSDLKKFHNDRGRITVAVKDLDDSTITHSLATGAEVDLPLHISELPRPGFSSWLVAGLSWEGFQRGSSDKQESNAQSLARDTNAPLSESTIDLQNRIIRFQQATIHRSRSLMVSGERDAPAHEFERLADIERHLSDLLEENERRSNQDGGEGWRVSSVSFQPRSDTAPVSIYRRPEDKWPVKVILHDVNWEKMTVQGIMIASQIIRRPTAQAPLAHEATPGTDSNRRREDDGSSMETIFDGEIIDFRIHEMETVAGKPGFEYEGLLNDLKYWSRIGPFKGEIAKRIEAASKQKALAVYEQLGLTGTIDEQTEEYKRLFKDPEHAGELDREDVGLIVFKAMTELLGSRKWLEKTMGEGGWIFMRWKERCFVTNSSVRQHSPDTAIANGSSNEHTRARTLISRPSSAPTANANTNDEHHERPAWGLTIRGFYYVALNRMSGNIDALYCDQGSHPYQELACIPVGIRKMDWKEPGYVMGGNDRDRNENDEESTRLMARLNVRSRFGNFEFR